MFELVEAAFDPVTVFVEVGVVRDRDLARWDGWDDGEHAGIGDELAKMVAVVGFVSNYGAALDALKQRPAPAARFSDSQQRRGTCRWD